MGQPRYQRRKEDRPQEITEAAFAAFADKGFAATKVEDVARRAGVSKGLLYLYFKTKEELFKAVIRSVVTPRVDELTRALDSSELGAEAFIRGPLLAFMKRLPGSPASVVIRLMISEARKHPDLVEYYWDNVASRGLGALRRLQAFSEGSELPDQLAAFGISGRFAGGLARLFTSHPPIEERIAALSVGGGTVERR